MCRTSAGRRIDHHYARFEITVSNIQHMSIKQVFEAVTGTLVGSRCLVCGGKPDAHYCLNLCQDCADELFETPLVDTERIHVAARYAGHMVQLVHRAKFAGDLAAASTLGELLARSLSDAPRRLEVDTIIPVPLHWRREWRRGFNQAHEIARAVGQSLGIKVSGTLVQRRVNTAAQARVGTKAARQRNVTNAFRVRRRASSRIQGQRIAVIDDVRTTGATGAAVAACLLDAGATRVAVWAVAQATLPAPPSANH